MLPCEALISFTLVPGQVLFTLAVAMIIYAKTFCMHRKFMTMLEIVGMLSWYCGLLLNASPQGNSKKVPDQWILVFWHNPKSQSMQSGD